MQVTYGKGFAVATKDQRVDCIENALLEMPQVDCIVKHYFADGVYAREITIPTGVALIGAIHKTHNFAVVNKGILRLVTDSGYRDVYAGEIVQVIPGQKNCGVAIEECAWTNFFANPTNERDTDKLVEMLTESKASELLGGSDNKQLSANRIAKDKADYFMFLAEYGISQDVVTKLVENTADQIPMPPDVDTISFCESVLHGKGLCAAKAIKAKEYVGPARIGGKRTPIGRYLNHSTNPNVEFIATEEGNLMAYALHDIALGEEITNCYRQAMRVNGAGFVPLKGKS